MSPSKKKKKRPTRTPRPLAAAEEARQARRKTDQAYHQALIKIHYSRQGKVLETPVETLGRYSPDFRKSILLVEDKASDSDRCRAVLHELGYDGIELITSLDLALEYLEDVLERLTHPPDAIILDLGLGYDSGFDILRKCNDHPLLQSVPILVWTKQSDENAEAFSIYLGAKDFLVKTRDLGPLRAALKRLLPK